VSALQGVAEDLLGAGGIDAGSVEDRGGGDWGVHGSIDRGWKPGRHRRTPEPVVAGARLGLALQPHRSTAVCGRGVQEAPVALVVFAGQSNALGFGMDRASLPSEDVSLGRTFIWNGEGRYWELMQPGHNTGTAVEPEAWGPEVAFAQAFRAANPDEPPYIVTLPPPPTAPPAHPPTPPS